MKDKNHNPIYLELLRYPVVVMSILLGLVGANWLLGLELSRITEFGPSGVKLSEVREDAAFAAADLEQRLDAALARIDSLEMRLDTSTPRSGALTSVSEPSEAVARLSRATDEAGTVLKGKQGFIWIGNFDASSGEWSEQNLLLAEERTSLHTAPSTIVRGSQYRIAINTYLRDGLPANDDEYFRGRKALGVIPQGTLLTVISKPVSIDREFKVQYWAEVEVEE